MQRADARLADVGDVGKSAGIAAEFWGYRTCHGNSPVTVILGNSRRCKLQLNLDMERGLTGGLTDMLWRSGLVSVAMIFLAGTSPAQTPLSSGSTCEVHAWPGAYYETASMGWADSLGGGVLGAALDTAGHLDRRITTAAVFQENFDGAHQASILKIFDYSAFLHRHVEVSIETSTFDAKKITKIATRVMPSNAPCYIEIYVLKNRYRYAPLPGKWFQTTFLIKDFRASKAHITQDTNTTKIQIFPALDPTQTDAAKQELQQGFQNNLSHSAEKAFGPKAAGGS